MFAVDRVVGFYTLVDELKEELFVTDGGGFRIVLVIIRTVGYVVLPMVALIGVVGGGIGRSSILGLKEERKLAIQMKQMSSFASCNLLEITVRE